MAQEERAQSSAWSAFQAPLTAVVVAILALFGIRMNSSSPSANRPASPASATADASGEEAKPGKDHGSAFGTKSPPLEVLHQFVAIDSGPVNPTWTGVKTREKATDEPAAATESMEGFVKQFEQAIGDAKSSIDIEFIIATVPDPIDSHFQLLFDRSIDAISRAASDHGYDFDRHHFLWTEQLQNAASTRKLTPKERNWRTYPSAILFRHGGDLMRIANRRQEQGHEPSRLLMVMLVGETPTAGVHKQALAHALDLVEAWRGFKTSNAQNHPTSSTLKVSILGPEFSGSASSLRATLIEWSNDPRRAPQKRRTHVDVTIISGSATSDSNYPELNYVGQNVASAGQLTMKFQATVMPDSALRLALLRHLVGQSSLPPAQIAFLTERNTAYGRIQPRDTANGPKLPDGKAKGQKAPTDQRGDGKLTVLNLDDGPARLREVRIEAETVANTARQWLREHEARALINDKDVPEFNRNQQVFLLYSRRVQFLQFLEDNDLTLRKFREQRELTFPLTLSRIRSEYEKSQAYRAEAANQPPSAPRKNLELSMEQVRYADDILPVFSDVTNAATDVTLEQVLSTIVRDDIRAVGLVGTDILDKLFLAQQIRAHAPNVRIFTLETDVLYTHADYSQFVTGTVIASSYPLFSRSRTWTDPTNNSKHYQFGSDTAQGIYNAALALLNEVKLKSAKDKDSSKAHHGSQARHQSPKDPHASTLTLLDYDPPFDVVQRKNQGPSLWLTMVGEAGMWPVDVIPVTDQRYPLARLYTYREQQEELAEDSSDIGATTRTYRIYLPRLLPLAMSSAFIAFLLGCYGLANWGPTKSHVASKLRRRILRRAPWLQVRHLVKVIRAILVVETQGQQLVALVRRFRPMGSERIFLNVLLLACASLWTLLLGSPFLVAVGRAVVSCLREHSAPLEFVPYWTAPLAACLVVGLVGALQWALVRTLPRPLPCAVIILVLSYVAMLATVLIGLGWIVVRDESVAAFVERAGTLGNGVSPLLPSLCLVLALGLWAVCHLRREYLLRVFPLNCPFPKTDPESPRAHLAGIDSRFHELRRRLRFRLCSLQFQHLASWATPVDWGVLTIVALSAAYILFGKWVGTAEGGWFDCAYRVGLGVVFAAYLGLFLRVKAVCGLFERLLRRLGQHPMVPSYGRVPERLAAKASGQLFAAAPHPGDLDQPVRSLRRLASLKLLNPQEPGLVWPQGQDLAATAEKDFCELLECHRVDNAHAKRLAAKLHRFFARIARECLVSRLFARWDAMSVQREPDEPSPCCAEPKPEKSPKELWDQEAEVFVAMHLVTMVRQVFAHVQNMLTFLTAMLLCLLVSLQGYPFQPRSLLLTLWFAVMAWTVGVIVVALIKFNRNEVLSRLSNTVPNRFTWDRSLIMSLAVYVATPIAGILFIWFPVLGRILFGWLGAIGSWPGV